MENAIYNSMRTANQLLDKQNTISNNLANVSTVGFKEKFVYLIKQEKEDVKNPKSFFNIQEKTYYNLSPGLLDFTNRKLDICVKDNGWLVVKDKNGQEAYTKNGHLNITSQGKLTIQNYEVVGKNKNINIPNGMNINVLSNGMITNAENKKNTTILHPLGELKLVKLPEKNIIQKENGLFYINKGKNQKNIVLHDKNVKVECGMLESSNVDSAKNMINMISNARQFDMAMKTISLCDENAEYANQLLNIHN